MYGSPLSPKFPTVALQRSKSSASVHSGGRIETSGTCAFNIHSLSLFIWNAIVENVAVIQSWGKNEWINMAVASWVRSLLMELMFRRWYSIELLTQFICLFMLRVESKYTPRFFASLLTATRWDPISIFRSFTWDPRWGFVITRNSVLSSLILSLGERKVREWRNR